MRWKTRICIFSIMSVISISEVGSDKLNRNVKLLEDKNENTFPSQNRKEETDCNVRQIYSHENWLGGTLRFMAFIEHGAIISISIGFQDQHMPLVYDKIIMSQEEITLCKIRNGNVEEINLNKYLDTAGWIWIEISMKNQQLILKYENTTALNYTVDQPVNELIVHGSNLTVCKDGTPTWVLEPGQSAKIPLEPSRQAVNTFNKKAHTLTLQSDDDFTPCIMIDENETCFELDDNILTVSNTSKPSALLTEKIDLHFELVAGFLNIFHQKNGTKNNVTRFPEEEMKFIEFTSKKSKFSVSLNVFVHPNSSSDFVSTDRELITTRLPNDTTVDNDLLIGILIGVASCVTAFTVLVIGFMILKKNIFPFTWKKTKKDDADNESIKQPSEKRSDENNPLVQ